MVPGDLPLMPEATRRARRARQKGRRGAILRRKARGALGGGLRGSPRMGRARAPDQPGGSFPDGRSALMLVAASLRHVAGTKWGTHKYMDMSGLRGEPFDNAHGPEHAAEGVKMTAVAS